MSAASAGTGVPESAGPFSRRALWWIIGVSSLSLLVGLVYLVFGDSTPQRSTGSNSFSRSALGHRGFVELLRTLDVPVIVSRHQSGARASGGLLVVAEPRSGDSGERADAPAATRPRHSPLLLVLPKRMGWPSPRHQGWIEAAELVPVSEVEQVLAAYGVGGTVQRGASLADLGAIAELAGHAPALAEPQLLTGSNLAPLLGGPGGILIGELIADAGERRVVVLSDPDLIANHGLDDGDNAALAVALVDHLRRQGAVVIDEAHHGFERQSSLLTMMGSFPWVLIPLGGLLTVLALLWAGAGRFGAPLPTAAPMARGKQALLDNTAELLRSGGHTGHVLDRYLKNAMQDVGQRLNAGAQVAPAALSGWLSRTGRARGVSVDLEKLSADVAALPREGPRLEARALVTARAIHRWRQEMIDGSRRDSRRQ
ncbi:MAG: hypothetical protein IT370_16800 [Deltaproteobacteria bacterium]|nr:hypothetical protein [Deltaproteobacteria bacterium]